MPRPPDAVMTPAESNADQKPVPAARGIAAGKASARARETTPAAPSAEPESPHTTAGKGRRRTGAQRGAPEETHPATDDEAIVPPDLSFQQARTALDLLLAELQASDLQVEEMLSLYRRAQAYANHCEAVLQRIDQDVIEWDVLQETRETTA